MLVSRVAVLIGAMSFTIINSRAQNAPAPGAPPAGSTDAPKPHPHGGERHPAIHRAIRALEEARKDWEHADHDFGGHRKQALAECDKAIQQLKLALQFDKK